LERLMVLLLGATLKEMEKGHVLGEWTGQEVQQLGVVMVSLWGF
jgi:hypothetical protein